MRRFLCFALLVLAIVSCSERPNVQIKGTIKGGKDNYIIAEKMSSNERTFLDSILIDENDQFLFEGIFNEPTFIRLKKNDKIFVNLLVNPDENINFTNTYNSFTKYELTGSEDSKLVRDLAYRLAETGRKIDSLSAKYAGNHPVEQLDQIRAELNRSYYNLTIEHKKYIINFLVRNNQSLSCILALYQQFDNDTYVFNAEEDFQYFNLIDSTLGHKYPEHEYVQMLHNNVTELKRKLDLKIQAEDKLKIGTIAPDIALPSPKGDTVRLSDLKGNYLVLNFWASWSEASRKNNQDLVKLYNKYEKKGLKIYQVSLDRSMNSWTSAIDTDKLSWINVSDLQFWNNAGAKRYQIQTIPMNIIINPEGMIAAKGLNGQKLDDMVNWFFTNVPPAK